MIEALRHTIFWAIAIFFLFMLGYSVAVIRAKRHLNLMDPDTLLSTWLDHIAAVEHTKNLHEHIIKHAQELTSEIEGNGTFETWSASMHNLLAIYDRAHGTEPDTELRLERLTAKYMTDPQGRAPPPAPLPAKIMEQARGPLIEQRRKAEAERQRAKYCGGY